MNLSGASVLLTGATGGIGHAIARRLHREGCDLVLTGRRAEVLEPLAAEVGGRALAIDLADRAQVDQLASECADVDVLVANAALPAGGHVHSFSIDEIDRALDVNLRAPIVLAHRLGERMVGRGRGHLLFVSSIAGKSSAPASSVYSATKFGLRGFAQGLRADLRPSGVGVTVVFPGFIRDAGMYADTGHIKLPPGTGTNKPEEVAEAVARGIEHNRGEITVAPLPVRASLVLAQLAPGPAAAIARRLGADDIGAEFEQAQRDKR